MFRTSQSKVNTYRKCHYAYHLRYNRKLRKKVKARPLVFGGLVHKLIEAHINGDDPWKLFEKIKKEQGKTFRILAEEYGEILEDVHIIMMDYFDYWKKDDVQYVEINGKKSEFLFEVEVEKGIIAVGKIDGIAKAKKMRWLAEHKTGRQLPNEDHRWRQIQSSVYLRIMEMAKLPRVEGIMWDYIRSKSPTEPQILKDGSVTKRALDTLPSKIAAFLKKGDHKTANFAHLISAAYDNRKEYFQRKFSAIKKNVVDEVFQDFVDTSIEMSTSTARDKHIGRHCDWCEYEKLCRAELQDLDVKFVRSTEYEVSKKHEDEEPDIEA